MRPGQELRRQVDPGPARPPPLPVFERPDVHAPRPRPFRDDGHGERSGHVEQPEMVALAAADHELSRGRHQAERLRHRVERDQLPGGP